MTKNQLYKLIERQIEIGRYEAHVRKVLLKRLSKLNIEVKGLAAVKMLNELTKKEMDALLAEIEAAVAVAYADKQALLLIESVNLANNEFAFTKRHHKAWGLPEKLPKINYEIAGLTVSEWVSKQSDDYYRLAKILARTNGDFDELIKQSARRIKILTNTWSSAISQQTRIAIADKAKNVSGYRHISLLDSRTSDTCLTRSDKTWNKDKQPYRHNLKWVRPPLHVNCRSFMAVEDDIASKPAALSVEEFLNDTDPGRLNRLLGGNRVRAFRKGAITMKDLFDQTNRPKELTH